MIETLIGGIVFLILFSIVLITIIKTKKTGLVVLFLCVSLLARFSLSILNAYFGPLPGADVDAVDFIMLASTDFTLLNVGTEVYLAILGIVFNLLEKSTLIGSLMSVVVVIPYLVIVCGIVEKYGTRPDIKIIFLIILTLLPSTLLFHSVSLREAYMVSGLAIFVYAGFKIIEFGPKTAYVTLAILGFALFGWLHKGTFIISIFNVIFLALICFKRNKVLGILLIFLIVLAASSISFSSFGGRGFEVIAAITDGSILDYTKNYRSFSETLAAKTTYYIDYNTNPIYFISSAITQYIFMPFPGQIFGLFGLYISLERVLTFAMIVVLLRNWSGSINGIEKRKLKFLIGLFIISSFIWGVGTSNYGTGMRHHTTHDFLLVLAAFIAISLNKKKYLR